MKKNRTSLPNSLWVLFSLRLFFYLSAALLLVAHPGIVIPFDRIGLAQWFVIIPLAALIAFLPPPCVPFRAIPRAMSGALSHAPHCGKLLNKLLAAFVPVAGLSLWAGGISTAAFAPFCAGAAAFALTLLLFHYPRWGKLSALEPFFFAWVCFRLLAFSRAGEEIAGESLRITQFILVWTAVVFLCHSVVVYLCLYPASSKGIRREGAIFGIAAAGALVLTLLILPADFVRNTVIDNLLPDRRERKSNPNADNWDNFDSRRRQGRRTLPGDAGGRDPSLRALGEHNWPGQGGRRDRGDSDGPRDQYTVMVVASADEPVYMANAIRARFDPVDGFMPFPDELMSRLSSQRFFVTWFDGEPSFDTGRESREVFALSTVQEKFLPYRPLSVNPTVLSENTGPFRYIHRSVSGIHPGDPLRLLNVPVRDVSEWEKTRLQQYLELPMDDADKQVFSAHLQQAMKTWEGQRGYFMDGQSNQYMETILAILMSFSEYQYDVNTGKQIFVSDVNVGNHISVSDMVRFLTVIREGACIEFSNTAALLGRLAGIPSRVVTGYLAADGLQTPAHLRGLAVLQSRIPLLQEFSFNDLILVTTSHAHSWTQFYVPEFGWIDFESTQFTTAPVGLGDGNLRDVVIPLWEENQLFAQARAFPWQAVLRTALFLAVVAVVGAYTLRYGMEAALNLAVRHGGRNGARALYLLLLARLAADGKPIKPVSKTAPEYARLFANQSGAFATFADIYTELRWRDFTDKAEMDSRFERLKQEYCTILAENQRKGILPPLIRLFSLRALAYL